MFKLNNFLKIIKIFCFYYFNKSQIYNKKKKIKIKKKNSKIVNFFPIFLLKKFFI